MQSDFPGSQDRKLYPFIFMLLQTISHRRHCVPGLPVSFCAIESDSIVGANFVVFTSRVHFGTETNLLEFEVKRSKVEVTTQSSSEGMGSTVYHQRLSSAS